MSRHIYHTEGFVLGSSNTREANKYYSVFTSELGLIRATAQGVRLLKSKLRFNLQDFRLISLSLVRGKDSWKIVNVSASENLLRTHELSLEDHVTMRVIHLVKRLVSGEEKNDELFALLKDGFTHVRTNALDETSLKAFEIVFVLRILHTLGYIGDSGVCKPFVSSPFWTGEILSQMLEVKARALQEINQSLKESQL